MDEKEKQAMKLRSKLNEINMILREMSALGLSFKFECITPSSSQKCEELRVRVFETKEY